MRLPIWAHPRVGGENTGGHLTLARRVGSSPRGRGKPRWPSSCPATRRLIPAWAGKTFTLLPSCFTSAAHPRVGGENLRGAHGGLLGGGSSPRGRGKPLGGSGEYVSMGLIPAWAGKTGEPRSSVIHPGAHPRVGGENAVLGLDQSLKYGSSPRGRGKHCAIGCHCSCSWLIPAWAGKTGRWGS